MGCAPAQGTPKAGFMAKKIWRQGRSRPEMGGTIAAVTGNGNKLFQNRLYCCKWKGFYCIII
jgi:hypothetical protein